MTPTHPPRVLMIAAKGFEDSELFDVRTALADAGAQVYLASIDKEPIKGVVWDAATGVSAPSAQSITPDKTLEQVSVDDYEALVLPGGLVNPDILRTIPAAVEIVQQFMGRNKVVAALCHAPWLLVEADVLRGRTLTGWRSIRRDLLNAGATVVDQEVVVDGNLISSRMPSDIPAFSNAIKHALGLVAA
ncbi:MULTISPECIES: type 1 glutamine amidotransferase domain-containing protein [Pseudomonas]|uniref:type 1 glutamine amidotransferase domain-containing protein n=1 Tax=Pseudomonas TaxID=286 RepID=UPI000877480E|nr:MULTISPECIES: type 1 glutamine amidotransferase domain-containing protein [Pseudomonas]MDB6442602.1 type 1 glutamine amidotransferase [Pseudomonas sp. 21TX0197]MDT8909244.1 type 1 glutamine amidotransferase domain-containing protein [Pseudomonas prosekii]ROO39665.1 peptidase C56 [Pseudomonas sp. AF76]ROO40035.1 peptidase C56 [Pseudomonas sp. 7SR1]SCX66028.1 protease I [Pseudomonas sp. NFACC32-1]